MHPRCPRCGLLHPAGAPCPVGNPLRPEAPLEAGTRVAGRYVVTGFIHRGAMSVVYLAEDRTDGRLVALKELRFAVAASAEEQREAEFWFARESFLLGSLKHLLIPACYGVFRENGHAYIAQEYVDGQNLEDVVRQRGTVSAVQVIAWGRALCDLLRYLHEQADAPLIFRDLKPANILVQARTGRLFVVDFGIAKPRRQGEVGTVIGTPGYAPPEQYHGLADERSDLYALGATLHRLLTGYDPERGQSFTFPDAHLLNPAVSPALAAVVARATALDPAARFPSAAALDAALASAGQAGHPASVGRRASRLLVPLSLSVAALLLLAIGAVVAMHGPLRAGAPAATPAAVATAGTQPTSAPGAIGPVSPATSSATPPSPAAAPLPVATIVTGIDGLGELTEYQLPTHGSQPGHIVLGPDGNIWFAEYAGNRIGRLTPGGLLTEFTVPTTSSLADLTAGRDGAIWFTEESAGRIGRLQPSGTVREYPLSDPRSEPTGIALGPDGAMWFVEQQAGRIGRITGDGRLQEFDLPHATSGPQTICAGPDGNLWFTEFTANAIGRISTTGILKEFASPAPGGGPDAIISGPGRNLWYSDYKAGGIGRITTEGAMELIGPSNRGSKPVGIAAGSDGSVWFNEKDGAVLGRVSRTGSISAIPLPHPIPGSGWVAAGAAGAVWFTEPGGDRIARLVVPGAAT